LAKCPNCRGDIDWDTPTCPACAAVFGPDSVWRPVPDNDEEAENLANKFAAQPKAEEPLSLGEGLWTVVKLCLSILLILVVLVAGALFVRRPGDWTMLAVLGFLVFLVAALWIDYGKPSRAGGLFLLLLAAFGLVMGRGYLTGDTALPQNCSGRRLLCELENQLYYLLGKEAVAALWFAFAAMFLYTGFRLFVRSPKPDVK